MAVPYDSDMERLPRPGVRSMAAAWVVEPIPGRKQGEKSSVVVNNGDDTASAGVGASENSTPPFNVASSRDAIKKDEADLILDEVPAADAPNEVRVDKGKGKMMEPTSQERWGSETVNDSDRFKVVG